MRQSAQNMTATALIMTLLIAHGKALMIGLLSQARIILTRSRSGQEARAAQDTTLRTAIIITLGIRIFRAQSRLNQALFFRFCFIF